MTLRVSILFFALLMATGCDPRITIPRTGPDGSICSVSSSTRIFDVSVIATPSGIPAGAPMYGELINNSDVLVGAARPGRFWAPFVAITPSTAVALNPPAFPSTDWKEVERINANAINDFGVIAGSVRFAKADSALSFPVVFRPSGSTLLSESPSVPSEPGGAQDVNERGWVVGWDRRGAVSWRDGGSVLFSGAPGEGAAVRTINNSGWAGGSSGRRPFVWRNGQAQDLSPMLPPNQTWCEVIDINERNSALISCFQPIAPGVREGRVVATFSYQLEGHDRPVEWYVSEPTRRFVGFDQNDSGCVLGWDAPSLGYTNARPVLHCGTFLFYIDSMLPPEWTLVSVGSVNNRGAMAATVRNNLGLDMAAVLTPRCD